MLIDTVRYQFMTFICYYCRQLWTIGSRGAAPQEEVALGRFGQREDVHSGNAHRVAVDTER